MIFVTLKFYTHSVPTERLSCWFIISTNLSFLRNLFYLGKFSTHIAFLRNASYKSNLPSSSFQHQTSNLKIFSLPFFLQFFADFSFSGIFARNIELGSRNFIGQEFLVYKIPFIRMRILIFFAII